MCFNFVYLLPRDALYNHGYSIADRVRVPPRAARQDKVSYELTGLGYYYSTIPPGDDRPGRSVTPSVDTRVLQEDLIKHLTFHCFDLDASALSLSRMNIVDETMHLRR